jgi:hypothetical protein
MMTGSPNIFMSVFMTIEQLSFLPLVNMHLTSHQVDLLIGSNQLQGLPNFIPGLQCASPQHPRKNYDFDCTNFLRIAQKELAILFSLGLIAGVFWIALCAGQNCSKVLMKVLPLARRALMMIMIDCFVKALYAAQVTGFNSGQEAFSWLLIVGVWLLYLLLGVMGCVAAFSQPESYPRLKHLLFNDLRPTLMSRLHFSLLTLHRTCFAVFIIILDNAEVQLLLLSVVTALVRPRQVTIYLLAVRPYQDIKDSVLQIGTHCVVTVFLVFLTLFEMEFLGNDKDLVSQGLMWCIMGVIVLHVIGMLLKVWTTAREIYLTEDEVVVTEL